MSIAELETKQISTKSRPPLKLGRCYIIIFIVSVIFLLAIRQRFYEFSDEGEVLQGAKRILLGQMPFRDFWTFRIPGVYWLFALLFKIFGTNLDTARIFMSLVQAGSAVLLFKISRSFVSQIKASIIVIIYVLAILPIYFVAYHHWLSLDCGLVALALLLYKPQSRACLLLAGLTVALSIVLVQSNGIYFGVAMFAGIGICGGIENEGQPGKTIWKKILQKWCWFIAGCSVPALLFIGWLTINNLWPVFWTDTVVWLYQTNNKFQSLSYWQLFPTLGNLLERLNAIWLAFCLPIVILGGVVCLRLWRKKDLETKSFLMSFLLLWLASAADLFNAYPRTDVPHMAYGAVLPLILGGFEVSFFVPRLKPVFALGIQVTLISFLTILLLLNAIANFHTLMYSQTELQKATVNTGSGQLVFDDSDDAQRVQALLTDLATTVGENNQIFIYPNDSLIYIIGNYLNPTSEDTTVPILVTPERVQALVGELETKKVKYVLDIISTREAQSKIFPLLNGYNWDDFPIQAYINQHYETLHLYGNYARLLVRKT